MVKHNPHDHWVKWENIYVGKGQKGKKPVPKNVVVNIEVPNWDLDDGPVAPPAVEPAPVPIDVEDEDFEWKWFDEPNPPPPPPAAPPVDWIKWAEELEAQQKKLKPWPDLLKKKPQGEQVFKIHNEQPVIEKPKGELPMPHFDELTHDLKSVRMELYAMIVEAQATGDSCPISLMRAYHRICELERQKTPEGAWQQGYNEGYSHGLLEAQQENADQF